MCESFNAILECELLVKHKFKNPREASLAVFDFIEGFYNPCRVTRRSVLFLRWSSSAGLKRRNV